jgi:hypothetical protein
VVWWSPSLSFLSLRCFMVTRRRFTHLSNWNKLL